MIKLYYIEYQDTVKFFYKDTSLEMLKDNKLVAFLKACYKKYGKNIKFKGLI